MLSGGMIRVHNGGAQKVPKHGSSLIERDSMLADVIGRLALIPLEFHASSVPITCVYGRLGFTDYAVPGNHHEKILRLSHMPGTRTATLSLTWQAG